jgi:hypothetical protein
MFDGELVYVPPADGPHGDRHCQLAVLIEAHTSVGVVVSVDLLTRTSRVDDIAPDISVRRAADPVTGRRQLPEIAFEVVSTESISLARRRAAKLIGRGTRRVFAIDVERSRALEWSTASGDWILLAPGGSIDDPILTIPLPIEPLIHAIKSDNTVARALLAKHNEVLEEKSARDRNEGKAEGKAEAVIAVLTTRGLPLDPASCERILAEPDPARLDRWIARAVTCATTDELFAET